MFGAAVRFLALHRVYLVDMHLTFSSITPLYGLCGLIFIEVVHT